MSARCGSVPRLPRRLRPSHDSHGSSRIVQQNLIYFVSLFPRPFTLFFSLTHSFLSFSFPELLSSCTNVIIHITLARHFPPDIKTVLCFVAEYLFIELSHSPPHSFTHSYDVGHTFLPFPHYIQRMRPARPESSTFSDYAGDRDDSGLGTHLSALCGRHSLPIPSLRSSWLVRLAEVSL